MKPARIQYPDWVYNALPSLYALTGLTLMLAISGVVAFAVGAVLISCAVIVWSLRLSYRRAFSRSKGHIDVLDWSDLDGPVSGAVQISWRSSYECGHPILDAQHRRLFGISNEFSTAVLAGAGRTELNSLLDKFVNQIDQHFSTEHALLAVTRQPISAEHREHHSALLGKAVRLRDGFHRNEVTARDILGFLVFEVVMDHIANEKLNFPGAAKKSPVQARRANGARPNLQFSAAREAAVATAPKPSSIMIYRETAVTIESDWQQQGLNRVAEPSLL